MKTGFTCSNLAEVLLASGFLRDCLAGGSPASGVLSSSLLLVLVSMILGCWALELNMMGDVAGAGWSVRLDGAHLDLTVARLV